MQFKNKDFSEAREVLKAPGLTLSKENHNLISQAVEKLEAARKEKDGAAMRVALPRLEALLELYAPDLERSVFWEYFESIAIAIFIALFLRSTALEAFKIPSGSMIPTMQIGDHIFVNKFKYGVRIPFTNTKFFQASPKRGEVIVFVNPCEEKDFIKRVVAVAGDTVEMRCSQLYVNGQAVPTKHTGTCSFWDKSGGRWHFVGGPDAILDSKECYNYQETAGEHVYDTIYESLKTENDDHDDFPYGTLARPTYTFSNDGCIRRIGSLERHTSAGAASACSPRLHYVVPKGHVFVMGDNRENSSDSRRWGPVPIENVKGKAMFIWWASQPSNAGGVLWDRIGKFVH